MKPAHPLIDHLLAVYKIKNDARLAERLGLKASAISKIRSGMMSVNPTFILAAHERLGIPVRMIRKVMDGY
jgi:transcriptional regulator with XRE-family HTH domain